MIVDKEFEDLAIKHGLDLNRNESGYLNWQARMCSDFWKTQQAKIDKLTHDLASSDCAARMLVHVLDNPVEKKEAVAA